MLQTETDANIGHKEKDSPRHEPTQDPPDHLRKPKVLGATTKEVFNLDQCQAELECLGIAIPFSNLDLVLRLVETSQAHHKDHSNHLLRSC